MTFTEEQKQAILAAATEALQALENSCRVAIHFDAPQGSGQRDRVYLVRVPRDWTHRADDWAAGQYEVIVELIKQGFTVSKTHVLGTADCERL